MPFHLRQTIKDIRRRSHGIYSKEDNVITLTDDSVSRNLVSEAREPTGPSSLSHNEVVNPKPDEHIYNRKLSLSDVRAVIKVPAQSPALDSKDKDTGLTHAPPYELPKQKLVISRRDGSLCLDCQNVLAVHHQSLLPTYNISELNQKAIRTLSFHTTLSHGCPLCLFNFHLLSSQDPHFFEKWESSKGNVGSPSSKMEGDYNLMQTHGVEFFLYYQEQGTWTRLSARVYFHKGTDELEANRTDGFGDSTSSNRAWKTASHWLSQCQKKHGDCMTGSNSFIPSRLLHVTYSRVFNVKSRPKVQMKTQSELPATVKYATLSHRWGDFMPKRLLVENIAELKQNIEVEELPQTFQDAITAVGKLGIKYLWIDSLCIIQDSAEDWERESVLMSKIYANGVCNLAATAAMDGRDGLFFKRDPQWIAPIKLMPQSEADPDKKIIYAVAEDLWNSGVESAPLNTRAWVCQERLFSPRTIHFGSQQLFWECKELTACESFPKHVPQSLRRVRVYQGSTKKLTAKFSSFKHSRGRAEGPDSKNEIINIWNEALVLYTRTSIRYETDKFMALSGLALEFREAGMEYLAGMWRPNLPSQLVWRADSQCIRATDYIAPTWSWASLKGPIWPSETAAPGSKWQDLIDILNVSVELAGESPVGQLRGGILQVRGGLFEARTNQSTDKVDSNISFLPIKRDLVRFLVPGISIEPDVQSVNSEEGILHFLPVLKRFGSICGLILEQGQDEKSPASFTRWGCFQTHRDDGVELLQKCRKSFDRQQAQCEFRNGFERIGEGVEGYKYEITIV